jgi:hypothetical protein
MCGRGVADCDFGVGGGAEELGHKRRCRAGPNVCRGADLRDPPGMENGDTVGELERFVLIVRDEDRGDPQFSL